MCVLFLCKLPWLTYMFKHVVFFFKQKTAYEMRISDWSSDVCSSDLVTWNCWRFRKIPEELVDLLRACKPWPSAAPRGSGSWMTMHVHMRTHSNSSMRLPKIQTACTDLSRYRTIG